MYIIIVIVRTIFIIKLFLYVFKGRAWAETATRYLHTLFRYSGVSFVMKYNFIHQLSIFLITLGTFSIYHNSDSQGVNSWQYTMAIQFLWDFHTHNALSPDEVR